MPSRCIPAVALVAAITLAACGDAPTTPPPSDPPLVGRVEVTDSTAVLSPEEGAAFAARVVSWTGVPMAQGVSWTSRNPAAASVDATGRVSALAPGETWIVAETPNTDGTILRDSVPLAVVRTWKAISVGTRLAWDHTCAITLDDRAWCWGTNDTGQFGTGSHGGAPKLPTAAAGGGRWRRIAAGYHYTCGLDLQAVTYCWGAVTGSSAWQTSSPRIIQGAPAFVTIHAGTHAGCGVTAGSEGWCWGRNHGGGLGDGTFVSHWYDAVPIAGGHSWRTVQPGSFDQTCGLTTAGRAYCWGYRFFATNLEYRDSVPRPVLGEHVFTALAVRRGGACALDTEGAAWCWDSGTSEAATAPVRVPTDHRFTKIAAGAFTACALTPEGQAWCWGPSVGLDGGSTPVPMGSEHRFVDIAAASAGMCGLTAGGALYCWRHEFTEGYDPAEPDRPVRIAHPTGAPTS